MAFGRGDVGQSEQPSSRGTPPSQQKAKPVSNAGVLNQVIGDRNAAKKNAEITADVYRRQITTLELQIEKLQDDQNDQRWAGNLEEVQALQQEINAVAQKLLKIDPHYDLQSLGINKEIL